MYNTPAKICTIFRKNENIPCQRITQPQSGHSQIFRGKRRLLCALNVFPLLFKQKTANLTNGHNCNTTQL